MRGYVELKLDEETTILLESPNVSSDFGSDDRVLSSTSLGEKVVHYSDKLFTEAVKTIRPVAETIITTVKQITPKPDEVEIGLNFGVSGSGNLTIVAGEANANIAVTLRWNKE